MLGKKVKDTTKYSKFKDAGDDIKEVGESFMAFALIGVIVGVVSFIGFITQLGKYSLVKLYYYTGISMLLEAPLTRGHSHRVD